MRQSRESRFFKKLFSKVEQNPNIADSDIPLMGDHRDNIESSI